MPPGSLARHLVLRLFPAVIVLVVLDLSATWVMTRKISLETWLLRDIFWTMVVSQILLISVFAWVLIFGVRSGLASIRSEEHTSELQSLMRISYAVFCLKKKKQPTNTTENKINYDKTLVPSYTIQNQKH